MDREATTVTTRLEVCLSPCLEQERELMRLAKRKAREPPSVPGLQSKTLSEPFLYRPVESLLVKRF